MILVIDNYDSFTYNLVRYLKELDAEVEVVRNDAVSCAEIEALNPSHILISPGPGTPKDAGISCEVIKGFAGRIPILGVCLGHQCIAEVFGGRVVRANKVMHGKNSDVSHSGLGIFQGLPSQFSITRYHSLLVDRSSLPEVLIATAHTDEQEIMGLQHREHPVFGVQFHPEAYLSEHGHALLKNFLRV